MAQEKPQPRKVPAKRAAAAQAPAPSVEIDDDLLADLMAGPTRDGCTFGQRLAELPPTVRATILEAAKHTTSYRLSKRLKERDILKADPRTIDAHTKGECRCQQR